MCVCLCVRYVLYEGVRGVGVRVCVCVWYLMRRVWGYANYLPVALFLFTGFCLTESVFVLSVDL